MPVMPTVTEVAGTTITGQSVAKAINAGGQVCGQRDTTEAFLWTPTTPNGTTGTMQVLPPLLPGWTAIANAIDSNGNAVGSSSDGGANTRAVFWPANGGFPIDLGTMSLLGGIMVGNSEAFGINDFGRVVGAAANSTGAERAFSLDPGSGMRDLGTLGGTGTSRARGVNNLGDVVGDADATDASGQDVVRAFLFPNGAFNMDDLLTLMPNIFGGGFFGNSAALAIDDAGEIVGWAEAGVPGAAAATPAVFQRNGAPLPIFPGIGSLTATNGVQLVVGNNGMPEVSAFRFSRPSFGLVDLSTFIGQPVQSATGVNAAGQIVANLDGGALGVTTAVLITP